MKSKCTFGPVPSRRLGRSLGVDLVPSKVCSYDCIFCQLGHTTEKTTERRLYVPVDEVLDQVNQALRSGPQPDHVTLSGSGEPTLHSGMGEVIRGIKRLTDIPVAVLTNGSLLWDAAVREDCVHADIVLPTLAAGDEETFERIHRPASGLTLGRIAEGLIAFRGMFEGEIWLEVFLLDGINTSDQQVAKIRALAEQIHPNRVQLNTAVRPPVEMDARPVPPEEMGRICAIFGPRAEVVAEYQTLPTGSEQSVDPREILNMLRRRPCTLDDIADGLTAHRTEVTKHLGALLAEDRVTATRRGKKWFYQETMTEGGESKR
jgi:wyosine [tRNA(Phe)-imidazoG37] synthetase (radical SAM superfamily)